MSVYRVGAVEKRERAGEIKPDKNRPSRKGSASVRGLAGKDGNPGWAKTVFFREERREGVGGGYVPRARATAHCAGAL
jgi:hypothetical protein